MRTQVREQKEEAEAFRAKIQAVVRSNTNSQETGGGSLAVLSSESQLTPSCCSTQNDIRVEHYLWQLFQVEEDAHGRKSEVKAFQDELLAFAAKEEAVTSAYREKKKEHSHGLREIKASRERVHELQDEIDQIEPRMIRLREQGKYSQKKIAEAENTEAKMRKLASGKAGEISSLKRDLKELAAAKAELETQEKNANDQAEESLLTDGARLDEYNRIKETVQIKTNLLRNELETILRQQSIDSNKVQTISQELRENEKICDMLAEDMKVADERIRNVSVLVVTERLRLCARANSDVKLACAQMKDVIVQTERAIVDSERDVRHAETDVRSWRVG